MMLACHEGMRNWFSRYLGKKANMPMTPNSAVHVPITIHIYTGVRDRRSIVLRNSVQSNTHTT